MPTLFRRDDSEYWWAWGYDAAGKRWRASTKQTARRAAERVARAIEREKVAKAPTGVAIVSIKQALDALRKHKERKKCRPATLEKFDQKRIPLERILGETTHVHTLTLRTLEWYVDERRKDVRTRVDIRWVDGVHQRTVREQPVSDQTIAMEIDTLIAALRRLAKHGLYAGDPMQLRPDVIAEATYQARDRWLPVEEYRVLLAELAESRRRYLTLYCYTGMRLSELYQCVRVGDRLVVTQTKGNAKVGEVTTREIPLSKDAKAVLDAHPLPWPVWPNSRMNNDLKRACSRAGIRRVSANDLRRTFCSWLCNAGVPELTTIKLMGHSSSAMVRKVYAQLAPSTLAEAISRLPTVTNT